MIKDRSGGSDQRCRLMQALVPLPHRDAIDRDTTADAKLEPAVGQFEAADDHVEIRTSQRADQANTARVRATRLVLKISDAALSGDLRCTCHRPRWKCGSEDVGHGRLRLELTADSGDQVPDTRMRLDRQEILNRNSAWTANPRQVVAHQIDDHDVLGSVLRRGTQRSQAAVTNPPRRSALDRSCQHRAIPNPQEQLGAETRDHARRTATALAQ